VSGGSIGARISALERTLGRDDTARAKSVRLQFLILRSGGWTEAEARREAERSVAEHGPVTYAEILAESLRSEPASGEGAAR
jgi:hypothetical protein